MFQECFEKQCVTTQHTAVFDHAYQHRRVKWMSLESKCSADSHSKQGKDPLWMHTWMCVCVCVCVHERERERESLCVSVCVCARACVCEMHYLHCFNV